MDEKFQEWNIRKQKILDIPSTKLAQIGVSCNVKVVTSKTIGLSESQISRLKPFRFQPGAMHPNNMGTRGAQYRYFVIDSISIILFPFLSIPISISIILKRSYQYQYLINFSKSSLINVNINLCYQCPPMILLRLPISYQLVIVININIDIN